MIRKLIISSADNPDWNGVFLKDETEQEMRDLDNVQTGDNDWIRWVLGHMFDCREFDGLIEDFVADCGTMTKVSFRFADGNVAIEKI